MNYFEVLYDTIKPFLDGEKRPLNTMEVSNMWLYTAMGETTLRIEQITINTVEDEELRKIMELALQTHSEVVNEVKDFLLKHSVPLPTPSPEKPMGDFKDIPDGAKLTDQEVANSLSFNLVSALTYGVRGLSESIRADVAYMFAKFLIKHLTLAVQLKQLMEKKGWIQYAPPFKP